MPPRPALTAGRRRTWATLACLALVAAFAALSTSAARTKNATIDEPVHLVSGLVASRLGDLRIDPDNPPLWKRWAAWGDVGLPVRFEPDGPVWRDASWDPVGEATWSARTLFGTPGTDGVRLLNRARGMMLVLGAAAAAATAAWAGRLGGPVAAVVAAAVFCLDPTVIAHASLVKSDVPFTLAMVLLAWGAWAFGRRATAAGVIALGVACGGAVDAKFSGLLAGPVLAALLVARALGPTAWPLPGGRLATTRRQRLAVAAAAGVTAAVVCVGFTWACYGFRYRTAPSPAVHVDLPAITARARRYAAAAALGHPATDAEVAARRPGALDRFVHSADDRRLLPQPLLAGLLYQTTNTTRWPAFLDGRWYDDGRVAYFPLAILYKTPLATLAVAAAVVLVVPVRRRWRGATIAAAADGVWWSATCVAVPAGLFAATALTTHVNIGLRSVLPLYPFLAVALGTAVAWAWRHRPRLTAAAAGVLLAALAAETVAAWPDYIPFFNAAVGGPRGGFAHLADSNLDWGQDVTALADWHRAHPGTPIYADLFVTGDASLYGLDCRPLWTRDPAGLRLTTPRAAGAVLAVSATHLRGLYADPAQQPFYADLVRRPPMRVLHGTIYLYADADADRPDDRPRGRR